jgi:hypothetical protein
MEEPSLTEASKKWFVEKSREAIDTLEGMVTDHETCVDPNMFVCPHTKNPCKTWRVEYDSLLDEVQSNVDTFVNDVKTQASEFLSMFE